MTCFSFNDAKYRLMERSSGTVGIAILGQDVHHNSITGCLFLAYHYIYCKNSWSIYHIQLVCRVWHVASHVNWSNCVYPLNIIWKKPRLWEKQGWSQVIVFLATIPSYRLQNPETPGPKQHLWISSWHESWINNGSVLYNTKPKRKMHTQNQTATNRPRLYIIEK